LLNFKSNAGKNYLKALYESERVNIPCAAAWLQDSASPGDIRNSPGRRADFGSGQFYFAFLFRSNVNNGIGLSISVVYRGCAVPVAWKVLKAQEKHAWKPEWQALLKRSQGLLPEGWTVIVLADRGLYAKWLFEAIVELIT